MKNTAKRLFALVMALAMVCGMLPANALAAGTDGEVTAIEPISATCINPLYADVVTEEDLKKPSDVMALDDVEYHTTIEAAGTYMRDCMETRQETIAVGYQTTGDYSTLLNDIATEALKHTKVPTEGDYLQWQFAGWSGQTSGYVSGSTYYLTLTYTVTYYTTAEQEAQVTTAVNSLLSELGVSSLTTDYAKIKAVYEWMCEGITYDYTNLEDDTYKLKYTAYAALLNKTAVCQGYANLLYRLALEMGVDCRLIAGIGGGGAHAWNIVQMDDGMYYNADSTWDAGSSAYSYFLVTDDNFGDHTRGSDLETYPIDYTSESFYASYPMGTVNYDPTTAGSGSDTEEETYIATGTHGVLNWTLSEGGVLTISGEGAMDACENGEAPWYSYSDSIKEVVLESGVTSIAYGSFFWLESLTKVTISDTVTSYNTYAFDRCSSLEQFVVSEDNTKYCNDAYGVLLTKAKTNVVRVPQAMTGTYTIPNTITTIGATAFADCVSLSGVTIPEGVALILPNAFSCCSSLTSIVIPDSVTYIGDYAFDCCDALSEVTIGAGVTEIGAYAFDYCPELEEVTIPASVTTIGEGAFEGCEYLLNIWFEGDAPTIDETAFTDVTANTYYPAGNTTWTSDVMQDYGGTLLWASYGETEETYLATGTCGDNLTWTLDENYVLTISGEGDMDDFESSTQPWEAYTQEISAVVIEDGVTSVGNYAFFHCYDIASVELPDSVTHIGNSAFFYCRTLPTIDLPDGLQTIGNSAFGGCVVLTEAALPESLISIGDSAFSGCALTSAIIPGGVTAIGYAAFAGCPLTVVSIPASVTSIGAEAFRDCAPLDCITVDSGNSAYCNDEQGALYNKDCTTLIVVPAGFAGEFIIPNTVTTLAADAFRNCDELTGVAIPDSVSAVGEGLFYDCAKLDNIVLPDSVTEISKSMFGCCGSLSSITIPDTVTSIGQGAFYNCTSLESITLPDSLTSIGSTAFDDCTALTAIVIPDGVTELPASAFIDCDALESVTLPDGLTSLGSYAFGYCISLATIDLPDGLTALDYSAFSGCAALTSIDIPDGVTSIGNHCFSKCSALTEVKLPAALETIDHHAFYYCTALTELSIPEGVTSVGDYCFSYSGLQKLTFEGNAPTFGGNYVFQNVAATAYYPADNDSWTSDVMQDYGGTITWEAYGETDDTTGDISWSVEGTTLTISGEGAMPDYTINESYHSSAPWYEEYNETVKTVILGDGITRIGNYAFFGFNEMTKFVMADSVVSIGTSAFERCYSLPSIELSDNLKTIGDRAFYGAADLTYVYIGATVESIGTDAYTSCSGLYQFVFLGSAPEMDSTSMGNRYVYLYYPAGESGWGDVVAAETNSNRIWTAYGTADGTNVASGTSDDGLNWVIDGSGVLTITGTGEMAAYDYVDNMAPWRNYSDHIVEVIIGEGITNIGAHAFHFCENVTSISLPGTLVSIDDGGLQGLKSLHTLVVPDSVTVIGEQGLADCDTLAHLTLSSNLVTMGTNMTSGDVALNKVTIPASVTDYQPGALAYGMNLIWIEVADGNTAYCNDAYGVMYSKDMTRLCQMGAGYVGSYTIPSTVTVIGENAFNNATSLTAISIPEGVETIEDSAFYNSYTITDLDIPDSVTTIGAYAFDNCKSLETVVIGDGVTTIGDYAFEYCQNITDITFGSSIETIGKDAFAYCYRMPSVILPDTVTSIDDSAFYGCNAIAELKLSDNLEFLGYRAFGSCDALPEVTIPNSVTTVEEDVFHECTGLTTVNLGTGLTVLGDGMFYKCSSLTDVNIPEGVTGIDDYCFNGCTALVSIELPSTLTEIGQYAFSGCTALTTISFPEGLTTIDGNVFRGCTALNHIDFPDSLTTVGYYAFYGCTGLEAITIPADVSFSSSPFYGCTGLKRVTFAEGVTSIPYNCFQNCTSLEEVTIPDTVTSMGSGAFQNCTGLQKVTIGSGITSISTNAFNGCTALTDVTIPNTVTSIGAYAFNDCTALVTIDIPESVTSLGYYTFCGCMSLKEITIPDSVTAASIYCFCGCTALESVKLSANLKQIYNSMFYGCTSLTEITIPASVTSISDYAFEECSALTTIRFEGNAPYISSAVFTGVTATAYYPEGDETWTEEKLSSSYGGTITWVAYDPNVIAEDSCGTNVAWVLTTDGTLTVTKVEVAVAAYTTRDATYDMDNYDSAEDTPWAAYQSQIKEVVIEAGVTSVGSNAFSGCENLTEVTIGADVAAIGENAFASCGTIESVTFEGSAPETISETVFNGTTATVYYETSEDDSSWENVNFGETVSQVEITAVFRSGSLTLEENIGVNFYVQVLDQTLIEEGTICMKYQYGSHEGTVALNTSKTNAKGYYGFTVEVAAKKMAEQIEVQMYDADGPVSKSMTYSVQQYCINKLGNEETNELTKALCKATLNYGAYAQLALGYNTDNLANDIEQMTEEDRIPAEIADDLSSYAVDLDDPLGGLKCKSATLVLESETVIRFYFDFETEDEGNDIAAYTFTLDGVEVKPEYDTNKGYYYIEAPTAAKDLDKMYIVGASNGEEEIMVTYGALSYVYSKVTNEKTGEETLNLVKALYAYYQAAEAYFEANN